MQPLRFDRGNAVKTTRYGGFRGVDLSTDPLLVDDRRSPWAPNLISDTGGMPEKRVGWRTLATVDAPVNGLFWTVIDGQSHLLIHGGTKLYERTDGAVTLLKEGIANQKSTSVFMNGTLYLFTGNAFLCYDGTSVAPVAGRVPEVVIGRSPLTGGGTPLEAVNLIQPKWTEGFLGVADAMVYQLSYAELDSTPVTAELMQADGSWKTVTEGAGLSVDRTTGKVSFVTAPGTSPVAGRDNVKITASKIRAGYADRVVNAKVVALYNDSTIFAAGAVKGMDTRSGWNDPTYWPDTGYDQVGSGETDIMGYLQTGEYLAIVKEDNEQDSTVFLRSTATVNGETTYIRKPAISGIGMIARGAAGTLRGENLFLSRQGVFAITSNLVTSEKMVQNRSYFVDRLLTRESHLDAAVTVEWDGYFLVAVNGVCYVLDGKQNKTYKQQSSDYVYECYHWDNIPASCFLQRGGTLWFGTSDGRICRFQNDVAEMSRYADDDAAIVASWSTRADDDGDFMRKKELCRRGSGVLIKPYTHSSAKVYALTEQDFGTLAASARMDIFDLNDFDFERFSFNTSERPQTVSLSCGARRYQTLQFRIENDQKDEGFGVFGIVKRFRLAGMVR